MMAERLRPDALAIRKATPAEVPRLTRLIADSARRLSRGFYTARETEAAIAHMFGVDSELIADGSYLVAERAGAIAGCGGWSRRRTLFGGDRFAGRSEGLLDPKREPARIRAFFVAPEYARQGVGTALLAACEAAAVSHGFSATTLMATLPGVPFYQRHGYLAGEAQEIDLDGTAVRFVPMTRQVLPTSHTHTTMK